jgi:spore photoproduct lyase
MAKSIDLKTPGVRARLEAMERLNKLGHKLAAHFDPIIYEDSFKENYQNLLENMKQRGFTKDLSYLSLGVVRFTKDVYRETERNYPESIIHTGPMVKSFDGKVRYHRPLRLWMMNTIKALAINAGVETERIYLCMEDDA